MCFYFPYLVDNRLEAKDMFYHAYKAYMVRDLSRRPSVRKWCNACHNFSHLRYCVFV